MASSSIVDAHALLSTLLRHANCGQSRVEFFATISQILLDSSGCDTIEIHVAESEHTYRSFLRCNDPGSFLFERRACKRDGREPGASPSNKGDLGASVPTSGVSSDAVTSTPVQRSGDGSLNATEVHATHSAGATALITLVVGKEKIGSLRLQSKRATRFGPEVIAGFEKLADALAVALLLQRADWATRERVKELTCLFAIAQVVEQHEVRLEGMLQKIATLLPPGWQYPDICAARVVVDGVCYGEQVGEQEVDHLTADIVIDGNSRGRIEVAYASKRPDFDEGPFLKEERSLINEVARQVALLVKRRQADEERSRLQDQLRHADRLATIGQLAAGVAHELNEPLGGVLGFAQLAKKSPRLPRQASQDVDRIIRAALHAREVVKRLMVFGRQSPPHKTQLSLNQLVHEGLEFVRPRCAHGGVEVVCELAPELPMVTADGSQLHQVLVNLLVNAAQAMQDGGRITISTRLCADPSTVCLSVEDTGPGMSEEVLSHIFAPFFTTKDVGQGTGLGLCVVHGIVTSHGGTIRVDSKLGRGTRFEVCLPAPLSTQ